MTMLYSAHAKSNAHAGEESILVTILAMGFCAVGFGLGTIMVFAF